MRTSAPSPIAQVLVARNARRIRASLRSLGLLTLVASILQVGATAPARAFKPMKDFGHKGIVEHALLGGTWDGRTYDPMVLLTEDGVDLRFSRKAVQELVEATAGVDSLIGEFWVGEAHCDDDLILECHRRLVDFKETATILLQDPDAPNGVTARRFAGRALHTLQDFYTHSNWVMTPGLGNTDRPFDLLGMEGTDAQIQSMLAPRDLTTCTPDGGTPAFDGERKLTTGYFKVAVRALLWDSIVEPGKCNHGGGAFQEGIHKDEPSRRFHREARHVAVLATKAYIRQILDVVDDRGKRAFMGIGGTLGFVIDDTGSMGSEIDGVIASVQRLIQRAAALPEDRRPGQYLLVRYGDASATVAALTDDPNVLLGRLRSIVPSGGGDCPEAAMAGLLTAVQASTRTGQLFLYTDADAKDAGAQGNVAFQANAKNVSISVISSGRCDKEQDPAYGYITRATGGQELLLGSSETEKVFDIIAPTLTGDAQPLIDINDNLGSGKGAAAVKAYDIPVDDTITTLSISASIETRLKIDVLRPGGAVVRSSDSDATITTTEAGVFATINSPAAGNWRVRFEGSGEVQLSVKGNSDIAFDDFAFVRETGRPGHEGHYPIAGDPLAGGATEARATTVGAFLDPSFEIRSPTGEVIDPTSLSPVADEGEARFGGGMLAPEEDFLVYFRARTPRGERVQRVFPATFRGQPIDVAGLSPAATVSTGAATEVAFRVTNTGPTRTLNLAAAEDNGLAGTPVPARVTLGQDESVIVRVPVRAAPRDDLFEVSALTLEATDAAEPAVGNLGATNLMQERDADGDGQADVIERGPGGNRGGFDGNGDGTPDRTQAHVASFTTVDGARYGTASVGSGARFRGFQATAAPGSEDGMQPLEGSWVRFTVENVPAGGAPVDVRLHDAPFAGAQQFGGEPGRPDATLYDFSFDGTTGARRAGNDLVVSYVDGGRGDADRTRNGRIEAVLGPGTEGGSVGSSTCRAGASTLCLNANRFRVEVNWRDPFGSGNAGAGRAEPLSGDTGYFWFFDASNVELVIKVLDARGLNGRFWVFYGALSNVEYTITITDTVTGIAKTYFNPAGRFASVGDTDAFDAARVGPGSFGESSALRRGLAADHDPDTILRSVVTRFQALRDTPDVAPHLEKALPLPRQRATAATADVPHRATQPAEATGAKARGPEGSTYSVEPLLAADTDNDGDFELFGVQDGPASANVVTFDGNAERIGTYCCSLGTTPRVTETLTDRGGGRLDLRIVITSVDGSDLYPDGFVSSGDRVPLDSGALTIGFLRDSDPLDWSPAHRVVSASAELFRGSRSTHTYDLAGFFGEPGNWDGDFGAVFPGVAGEGTNRIVLNVSVQEEGGDPTPTGPCRATATRMCLSDGRFAVDVQWRDPFGSGDSGAGQASALTGNTGTFWFFDPANVELIVKVLDARALNGRFWVFYGALSNVEYTLTVTDTVTGQRKTYRNPAGNFGSRGDTDAF